MRWSSRTLCIAVSSTERRQRRIRICSERSISKRSRSSRLNTARRVRMTGNFEGDFMRIQLCCHEFSRLNVICVTPRLSFFRLDLTPGQQGSPPTAHVARPSGFVVFRRMIDSLVSKELLREERNHVRRASHFRVGRRGPNLGKLPPPKNTSHPASPGVIPIKSLGSSTRTGRCYAGTPILMTWASPRSTSPPGARKRKSSASISSPTTEILRWRSGSSITTATLPGNTQKDAGVNTHNDPPHPRISGGR
jgi:hypothetical protein